MTVNTVRQAEKSHYPNAYRTLREKALILERIRTQRARLETPMPLKFARAESSFTSLSQALARGYVWEPLQGVLECPRCPGALLEDGDDLRCRGRHVRLLDHAPGQTTKRP